MTVVCFVLEGGAEAKVKICQGNQIRAALVSVCDFKRRDVHLISSNDLVDRCKFTYPLPSLSQLCRLETTQR